MISFVSDSYFITTPKELIPSLKPRSCVLVRMRDSRDAYVCELRRDSFQPFVTIGTAVRAPKGYIAGEPSEVVYSDAACEVHSLQMQETDDATSLVFQTKPPGSAFMSCVAQIPVVPQCEVRLRFWRFQVQTNKTKRIGMQPKCSFGPLKALKVSEGALAKALLKGDAYFGDFAALQNMMNYLLAPEGAAAVYGGAGKEELVRFCVAALGINSELFSITQADTADEEKDGLKEAYFRMFKPREEGGFFEAAFSRLQKAETQLLLIQNIAFPQRDKNMQDDEQNRITTSIIKLLDDSEAKRTQKALCYSVVYIAESLEGTDQALRRAGRMGVEVELPGLGPELRRRWILCLVGIEQLAERAMAWSSIEEYLTGIEQFENDMLSQLSRSQLIGLDKCLGVSSGLPTTALTASVNELRGEQGDFDFDKLSELFCRQKPHYALSVLEQSRHVPFAITLQREEWRDREALLAVGLEEQLKALRDNFNHAQNPLSQRLQIEPQHALIWGVSGSGKSLLAQLARNAFPAWAFFVVDSTQIFSQFVGESEQNVIQIFKRARQNAPAVIVLDQFDVIVGNKRDDPAHKQESGVSERVLAQLLTELDGVVEHSSDILCIATSQKSPDELDPAVTRPGRLGLHIQMPEYLDRQAVSQAISWATGKQCAETSQVEENDAHNPFSARRWAASVRGPDVWTLALEQERRQ